MRQPRRGFLSGFLRSSPRRYSLWVVPLLVCSSGCFPKIEAPPLDSELSHKEANSIMFDMQAKQGNIYKVDLDWNGKPFQANWEISNFLHRNVQLQIKPPTAEFDEVDLCMALETALLDEETCPWHNIANDTVIRCYRRALLDPDSSVAGDWVAGTPYEVNAKVKKNGSEWFCQIKIHVAANPEKVPDLFLD